MGGVSFLLNKKFHPARLDNQKKVFIAEEKTKEKKKREDEAAKEVLKEREASYYENLGQIQARDARQSSLKFMYATPNANGKATSSSAHTSVSSGQEDPAVVAFYAKINERKNASSSSSSLFAMHDDESSNQQVSEPSIMPEPSSDRHQPFRQKKDPMSNPLLKNAPREGSYVSNMSNPLFKPFSEKLRNVQCSLCGEWGHRFGDRECSMRDYNPHDQARLLREDPMTYFKEKLPEDKQRMVLAEAARKRKLSTIELAAQEDLDEESDPEAEFLATLTPREKKLLLRKLQILQGEEVLPLSDSDTASSSSSSSSDESDSEDRHHRKKKKHKTEKKKSKHKHKHSKDRKHSS
jgi:CBF1 interacting corepressor